MRSRWGRWLAHTSVTFGAATWLAASTCRLVGVRVNVSPSIPLGVYRVSRGPVRVGSIVETCLPARVEAWALARGYLWRADGSCSGGAAVMGKIVAGMAGDTVDVSDDGVTVNGVRLPHSRPLVVDATCRPLPRLRGRWVLGSADVWLYGSGSSRSLDSRYFGPVSRDELLESLTPVWTTAAERHR